MHTAHTSARCSTYYLHHTHTPHTHTCVQALLDYIMVCCQCKTGGLRDKPGKGRDYYHTCYCISGASVAATMLPPPAAPPVTDADAAAAGGTPQVANPNQVEVPAEWRSMRVTNPVYNVAADKVERAMAYFSALSPVA